MTFSGAGPSKRHVDDQAARADGGQGGGTPNSAVDDNRRNDLAQMLDGAIHDLRTPLGAMSGWLEVIETELGSAGGVLGKSVAGLRRAIDEQARMIQAFGNAFDVLHEPFDPLRRTPFIDRLLMASSRLDAETRARIGSLEHLRGLSKADCIDGGNCLDDGLFVFLKLLGAAATCEIGSGCTIDGQDEGLVVHLQAHPQQVESLLAFCNGLNRAAVKRARYSLPELWSARSALLDSGLEPGARVDRRTSAAGGAGAAAGSAAGSVAGSVAGVEAGLGPAGRANDAASVDMVIWLRIVQAGPVERTAGAPEASAVTLARAGHGQASSLLFDRDEGRTAALNRDADSGRAQPLGQAAGRPDMAGGLAAVGALAAGGRDDEDDLRAGEANAMSLSGILSPTLGAGLYQSGLAGDHGADVDVLPALSALKRDEGSDAGSRTILVVDDQKDIREMLALWLRCHQFQVVIAGSAREARQRLAENGEIQAALIDIRMPEEDGIALLRSIRDRETERGERRMPALAITAQPSFETQTSALQAGFSGMLSKPLRLRQLIELVENLH